MRITLDFDFAKNIGEGLAHASDEEQSELLNAFATELRVVCGRSSMPDMQSCYISNKLNHSAEEFVLELAEFIKLRRTEEGR